MPVTAPIINQTPAYYNQTKGKGNYKVGRTKPISRVTFHHIVGTGLSAQRTFENPNRKASATYSVGEDGLIRQHVKEEDTPYSDGVWESNLKTISIEHAGGGSVPYTEEMYKSAIQLVAWILSRYPITDFKRHRELSATACPGGLDVERIIRDAQAIAGQAPSYPAPPPDPAYPPYPGQSIRNFTVGRGTKVWQAQMKKRNWKITVDDKFGPQSEKVLRYFQREKGLVEDGVLGPISWRSAWVLPIT